MTEKEYRRKVVEEILIDIDALFIRKDIKNATIKEKNGTIEINLNTEVKEDENK